MHSIPIQPNYNAPYKCEFQSQFISEGKYSLFWLSSFWTKRFSWKFLYIFRIRECNRHILPIATIFMHTRSFSFDQATQSVFLLFLEMLDGKKKTENEYAEHASSFFSISSQIEWVETSCIVHSSLGETNENRQFAETA